MSDETIEHDGNPIDYEKEISKAIELRTLAEAEAKASADQLKATEEAIRLTKYATHRADSLDYSLATLGVAVYDKNTVLRFLQNQGLRSCELRDEGGTCVPYLDGQKTSMAAVVGRLRAEHAYFFKDVKPDDAKTPDPDAGIKARDQFRSNEHRLSYIARHGADAYERLYSSSRKFYTGPAIRLTAEHFKELAPAEHVRACLELGESGIVQVLHNHEK